MTVEQIRAQIISSIWQAVAQSGVDLSTISQEKQEQLVRAIADRLMLTVNSLLDEIANEEPARSEPGVAPAEEPVDALAEPVLWRGRPFLSLVEKYTITSERLKIVRGLLARNVENFELVRIQDIDFKQGVGERMLGIGDINIRGHDPSNPEIVLRNVVKPEEVYEILRRAWLEARKRHGLQFREYM